MILSYSKHDFIEAIIQGEKIHTIRTDVKKRWKAGMSIQHWRGNPRNVHSKVKPYQFHEGVCDGVQEVRIECMNRSSFGIQYKVWIGLKILSGTETHLLAVRDGLTVKEFSEWFLKDQDVFIGRIIHFTPLRY